MSRYLASVRQAAGTPLAVWPNRILLASLGDGGAARVRLASRVGPLRPVALAQRVLSRTGRSHKEFSFARRRRNGGSVRPSAPTHPLARTATPSRPCADVLREEAAGWMAPDSKTLISSPPSDGTVSMIAGIRLFGEMARNSGLNWSPDPCSVLSLLAWPVFVGR
jgi:hypothetical protein